MTKTTTDENLITKVSDMQNDGPLLIEQISQNIFLGDSLITNMIIVSSLMIWASLHEDDSFSLFGVEVNRDTSLHVIAVVFLIFQVFIVMVFFRVHSLLEMLLGLNNLKYLKEGLQIIHNHSALLNPFSYFEASGNESILRHFNIFLFTFIWFGIFLMAFLGLIKNVKSNTIILVYSFSFILIIGSMLSIIWDIFKYLYFMEIFELNDTIKSLEIKLNPANNKRLDETEIWTFIGGLALGVLMFFFGHYMIKPAKKDDSSSSKETNASQNENPLPLREGRAVD